MQSRLFETTMRDASIAFRAIERAGITDFQTSAYLQSVAKLRERMQPDLAAAFAGLRDLRDEAQKALATQPDLARLVASTGQLREQMRPDLAQAIAGLRALHDEAEKALAARSDLASLIASTVELREQTQPDVASVFLGLRRLHFDVATISNAVLGISSLADAFAGMRESLAAIAPPPDDTSSPPDRITERTHAIASALRDAGLPEAAHYLISAHNLIESVDDELEYPQIIHRAVGALEELVCSVSKRGAKRLDAAVDELISRRQLTDGQGDVLKQAYILRHRVRGAGHGAGACQREVALFVLERVRLGCELVLRSFE